MLTYLENNCFDRVPRLGANCRSAARARSKAEFVAKIGIVVEEADEAVFWLELLRDGSVMKPESLKELMQEANELAAIFTAAHQTAKRSN